MSCALLPGCVPGLAAAFAVEPPQAAGQTNAILAARQTAGFERIGEPQQATVAARCDRRELQFTALIKIAEITEQQRYRKSTRLNSSHYCAPRLPSSASQ